MEKYTQNNAFLRQAGFCHKLKSPKLFRYKELEA